MVSHGVDRSGGAGGTGASVSPIDEQLIDAKGDLIAGTANNSAARLAVGTDTYILSALSSEATGLIWLSPADVFQDAVDAATAETAPAIGDFVLLSDVSLTPDNTRKMTLENVLKVVNGLTEDTTPDTDDFLLAYDVSASGVKKVKPENLPLAARKNAIINGAFDVWQRGTTFTGVASGTYTADRWKYGLVGAAVHTVSRSTDVPTVAEAGQLFNYSILVDCTTADASIAAGDITYIAQRIEGYNWRPLAQRACKLSFWVKATKTGTYCVGFANSIGDRSMPQEYTINASATWEKKTIDLPASPSAGTWDYTTGLGLEIFFIIAAGSNFHAPAGSWQSAVTNGIATANQVNGTDNTANDFRIAGVQLEPGSVATDFEYRTFQDELALCQRYFAKTFNYGTTPAQNVGVTQGAAQSGRTWASSGGLTSDWFLPVQMRAVPTVTSYNWAAANANWRTGGGGEVAFQINSSHDHHLALGTTGVPAADTIYFVHLTASAEL